MPVRKPFPPGHPFAQPQVGRRARKPRNDPSPPVLIDPDDPLFKWASKLSIEDLAEMGLLPATLKGPKKEPPTSAGRE